MALCPLTGTPAPGGVVPDRPALAIKIDNYSLGPAPAEARPQSGLDYADIIFEEQVEGSITRYAAVFQCREAPGTVGPVRSARWTDIQMLSQLGHPIFVHVGGITPVLDLIEQSRLVNVDLIDNPELETNPPGRYAPVRHLHHDPSDLGAGEAADDTACSDLHVLVKGLLRANRSPRSTSTGRPRLTSIGAGINARARGCAFYNVGSTSAPDVQPDVLTDGVQNQAQNVIVQQVNITYGPWLENSEGGLEAESHILDSSGKVYVFRNGRMIVGHLVRGSRGRPHEVSRRGRKTHCPASQDARGSRSTLTSHPCRHAAGAAAAPRRPQPPKPEIRLSSPEIDRLVWNPYVRRHPSRHIPRARHRGPSGPR